MGRGRPREFDTDTALDAAMALFWRYGYEGTSVAELAEAAGVNAPSLYAAFGNKEELFRKVVDRYIEKPASYLMRATEEPTARRVAEKALVSAIDMVAQRDHPDGCLLVQSALACGPQAESIRKELSRRRSAAEMMVRRRFDRAVAEHDLPPNADTAQLARYLMTIIWGLSVQAAGGASREQMLDVVDVVMQSWPF